MPKNLKTVGVDAFNGCKSLVEIYFYDGVETMGNDTFRYCYKLQKVRLPQNLTEIPRYAFEYNTTLTDIVLPSGITKIGSDAFKGCSSLKSMNFGESLQEIGSYAFYDCSFTEISLPSGVNTIGTYAFSGSSLEKVVIAGKANIMSYAFASCPNLAEVIMTDTVSIAEHAFSGCGSLDYVIIPVSVKTLSNNAFEKTVIIVHENSQAHVLAENNNLPYALYSEDGEYTSMTIDGAKYFVASDKAFLMSFPTSSVGSFEIPATVNEKPVTHIMATAFQNCRAITSLKLPDCIEYIGFRAFSACIKLCDINIPQNLKTVSDYSLESCLSLAQISFPSTVSFFGNRVFPGCSALESVILPDCVNSISSYMFNGLSSLKYVKIPEGVTEIQSNAFANCTALETLELPENITHIYDNAFKGSGLVKVVLPSKLVYVGSSSFADCKSLSNIELNEGLKTIAYDAFSNCTTLNTIIIPESVTSISASAFTATILLVYENSYAQTFAEENGLPYALYSDSVSYTFEVIDGIKYYISNGSATVIDCDASISASLVLPSDVNGNPVTSINTNAFYGRTQLTSVTLPEGILYIGKNAFYGCTQLNKIIIPTTTKSIGDYAFSKCSALKEITLSEGITEIGYYAFSECTSLAQFAFPSTVTSIDGGVFNKCSSLKKVILPNNIAQIPNSMFRNCSALEEVNIPESVTSFGDYSFEYCTSLEEIYIPDRVTRIGTYTFRGCSSLKEIVLPESLGGISASAFRECTSLKSVSIPGIDYINENAFRNCSALSNVVLHGGTTDIAATAFANCPLLKTVLIPESVNKIALNAFPNTIILVYKDSAAHKLAVSNGIPYFVMPITNNPEIAYGAEISGTVTHTDGSVAPGVTMEILYEDGTVKESVVTDENGAYSFTYAEVGKYTLRATDAEKRTASDTVSVKRMNVFDVFLQGETDLVLKNSWNISGTVSTDETATITLGDTNGNTITETESTDGTFCFENIPNGSYIIKAETESASTTVEVTVFNASVSDIVIDFPEAELYATVKGYVEVEDREFKHHRRHWVEVTIYNSDGVAVDSTRTDKDGEYIFKNLPADDYSIVAHTEELRPDRKKHHDRPHKLMGYAYVTITEAVVYEVETIILYEENDKKATINGKVTANGETQDCEVTLSDVFRNEIAHYTTKKNGKYSFANISDGLYFVTAITKSDGMGFTVVVVRDGEVYGQTDIKVLKGQHIHDREQRWRDEIPECASREDAILHRDRIAEEKRYFDGLSEKEKKQFSKEYRDQLNKYSEWIADYEYSCNNENVKVENGGMIMSGDELESDEKIEIVLNITESEGHTIGENGIKTEEDFVQQSIENTAGKHEIAKYYDITLSKKKGGKEHSIKSVCRDTDTTGKIRITMDIPEEYRGHKHYSFVHVHNGEALTLTDLDDNPNTVTFEIDRFSTFTLVYTDEEFVVEDGGNERLSFVGGQIRTDDPQGLRFVFSIDKEFYDTLEHPTSSSDTGLGFGSVVMPKKYLGKEKLVKDLETVTDGKKKKAKTAPAVNLFEVTADSVLFTVCILDIPKSGYTEEYVAVPYATYTENGEEITVYGNMTANVTVYAIAELAYADEKTSEEAKQYIYDNILSVVDPEKYPVTE